MTSYFSLQRVQRARVATRESPLTSHVTHQRKGLPHLELGHSPFTQIVSNLHDIKFLTLKADQQICVNIPYNLNCRCIWQGSRNLRPKYFGCFKVTVGFAENDFNAIPLDAINRKAVKPIKLRHVITRWLIGSNNRSRKLFS